MSVDFYQAAHRPVTYLIATTQTDIQLTNISHMNSLSLSLQCFVYNNHQLFHVKYYLILFLFKSHNIMHESVDSQWYCPKVTTFNPATRGSPLVGVMQPAAA